MQDVLDFWFSELDRAQWFKQSDDNDRVIRERFETTYFAVLNGETDSWRATAEGRLAEIIVLDQFARNIFRGTSQAFAADPVALVLAQELVRRKDHLSFDVDRRTFACMPFMHSESAIVHEQALIVFADLPSLNYEKAHKDVIDRFGRYPHRNEAMGRESTEDEIAWMQTHKGF